MTSHFMVSEWVYHATFWCIFQPRHNFLWKKSGNYMGYIAIPTRVSNNKAIIVWPEGSFMNVIQLFPWKNPESGPWHAALGLMSSSDQAKKKLLKIWLSVLAMSNHPPHYVLNHIESINVCVIFFLTHFFFDVFVICIYFWHMPILHWVLINNFSL